MDREAALRIAREIEISHGDAKWMERVEAMADAILEGFFAGRRAEHLSLNLPRDYYGGSAMAQPDGHP